MEIYSSENLGFSLSPVYMKRNIKRQKNDSKHSICLVCGKKGHHNLLITDYSNYVTASGTPLSKFLLKVIGEEPSYIISELMCQQCFVLLDRLDTYLARANELNNHICTRYKETKLEFIGNRQRISELITESLSDIKSFKNGTTLNVSDELSVTVFHEALPRKGNKSVGKPTTYSNLISNDISSSYVSCTLNNNYLKRKQISFQSPEGKEKYFKKFNRETISVINNNNNSSTNNNNSNNNNNNSNNKCSSHNNENNSNHNYKKSDLVKISNAIEESESDIESDTSINSSINNSTHKSYRSPSRSNKSSGSNATNSSRSNSSCTNSTSGGDSSRNNSASSSNSDTSDDEEKEDKDKRKTDPLTKSENSEGNKNEIQDKTGCENAVSKDSALTTVKELSQENRAVQESGLVESHLTEAVLAQSSLASDLLQSFLSTSLWMSSPESNQRNHQASKVNAVQNLNIAEEDVTVESFNNALGSIRDKKKRLELKNTGQSYINTKGKLIEAKRVWPQDCSRCPLKCNSRLNEDLRQAIFAEYWGLADYDLQREYLASHMERVLKVGPSGHSRTVVIYYLTLEKKKMQVCRQFFLKTLDVSEKASRIVLEKKHKGEFGGESTQ